MDKSVSSCRSMVFNQQSHNVGYVHYIYSFLVGPQEMLTISCATKHFVNDTALLVRAALDAIPLTNPTVACDAANKIIYRKKGYSPQVSIVSGGGSGYEPAQNVAGN